MMKKNNLIRKKYLTLFLFLMIAGFCSGQKMERSVFAIAGGGFEAGNYRGAYTVGEVVIGTAINGSNALTQGFQQGTEKPLSVKDNYLTPFIIKPNPTSGIVQVINDKVIDQITVFDQLGCLVFKDFPKEKIYMVNLNDYNNGIYYVVIKNAQYIKTEKLVLNK